MASHDKETGVQSEQPLGYVGSGKPFSGEISIGPEYQPPKIVVNSHNPAEEEENKRRVQNLVDKRKWRPYIPPEVTTNPEK